MNKAGRRQTALPPEKSTKIFRACEYPPLSTPTHSVTLSVFSPAICFSTALFGKNCCAWCVVLRKHSDDFLLTFHFFFISFAGFSLLLEFFILLFSIVVNDIQKFVCKFDVCNFYNTIFFCWKPRILTLPYQIVDLSMTHEHNDNFGTTFMNNPWHFEKISKLSILLKTVQISR